MSSIPQIIHQSWKNQKIPHQIYRRTWIESWSAAHPGWERKFWTDRDNDHLVREDYPEFHAFFRGLRPNIKKADFARYLYMHRYGGVYVDLDFICLKNLSPLLKGCRIVLGRLSRDNFYYRIPNAFLASNPGNSFWMQVARDARDAPASEQSIERHTGPFRLQWSFERYRPRHARLCRQESIYPLDWIHFRKWHDGRHYRADRVRLAREIHGKSVAEIARLFPRSYCVTVWTHNW